MRGWTFDKERLSDVEKETFSGGGGTREGPSHRALRPRKKNSTKLKAKEGHRASGRSTSRGDIEFSM